MNITRISANIANQGYAHTELAPLLQLSDGQIADFKDYWNRLAFDQNFKDYTHRERRILRYRYQDGQPLLIIRSADFQPKAVYENIPYTRGVNHLSYAEEEFISHPELGQVLELDMAVMRNLLDREKTYELEVDQFRVKAENGETSPTTSGIHQDGLDWVFMHFINADNVQPVVSELFAAKEGAPALFEKPMQSFMETVVVNDRLLYHRAGPVRQRDATQAACRDLLLISFTELSA